MYLIYFAYYWFAISNFINLLFIISWRGQITLNIKRVTTNNLTSIYNTYWRVSSFHESRLIWIFIPRLNQSINFQCVVYSVR